MQYRQGDVFIERIRSEEIPPIGKAATADPIARTLVQPRHDPKLGFVLAYGEVTGHSHRLAVIDKPEVEVPPAEDIGFFEAPDGTLYLQVKGEAGVDVRHEEHDTVHLPKGDYKVGIQREYTPQGERQVWD